MQFAPPADAKLTAGDPIKNAQTILRHALPIDNKPIRDVQVIIRHFMETPSTWTTHGMHASTHVWH